MAPTIAELSRLSGCSAATVSRAINNSGAVSAKARNAVLRAMRETQYLQRKGGRKRGRRTEQTPGLIEVILHRHSPWERLSMDRGGLQVGPLADNQDILPNTSNLGSSFYRQIVDGVLAELERWGHRAVVQANRSLLDPALITDINSMDRAGVLLLGEYSPDLPQFIAQCLHPMVLVDIVSDSWPDVVTADNTVGIAAAFDHVYALRHRKIGFIGKLDPVVAFAERFTAYKLKMTEAGLPMVPQWVYEGPNHIDVTAAGARQILERPDRPTALLCANDCSAFGVLRAAAALGLCVPGDLSIVGFDDMDAATLVTPPLTTVHMPMSEIGRQAVRQLMIQIQAGGSVSPRGCRIRLLPELVVRQSTGPVPSSQ